MKIIWPAVSELIDAGAPEDIQKKIRDIASNTMGVREVHAIRSRYISSSIQIDLHIVVDGNISVREGHTIADDVENNIIGGIPEVLDVVVHVDPSQVSSDNQFSVENN
jgi:divalent metal cation (Fe/Co/Zn/Cd) transporter